MDKSVIIVGAGPTGIALAYFLKQKLNFQNFTILESEGEAGGVWTRNTYPGCGCDIPSCLYSFSFAQKFDWSRPLAGQPEILQYLKDVMDKFDLKKHVTFGRSVKKATWSEETQVWSVEHTDNLSGKTIVSTCSVLVTAAGIFGTPRIPNIKGLHSIKGRILHTGAWPKEPVNFKGRQVAIIGNGCSGVQVLPAIVDEAASVAHFARSRQWFFPRPNDLFTPFQKFLASTLPLYQRWKRSQTYWMIESMYVEYLDDKESPKLREASEKASTEYILKNSPEKYHKQLIPDFPMGCKRRVMDPGYLNALYQDKVELIEDDIDEFTVDGHIKTKSGECFYADDIIFATGYTTQEFLSPMEIYGENGASLRNHWKETKGPQAYCGALVSGFPNFAIACGPNSSPVHNSVIFVSEVHAEFITNRVIKPVIEGQCDRIMVRKEAENRDCEEVQKGFRGSVFVSGCTNWNTNAEGRVTTTYPGMVREFWYKLRACKSEDFEMKGGSVQGSTENMWKGWNNWGSMTLTGLLLASSIAYAYEKGMAFMSRSC